MVIIGTLGFYLMQKLCIYINVTMLSTWHHATPARAIDTLALYWKIFSSFWHNELGFALRSAYAICWIGCWLPYRFNFKMLSIFPATLFGRQSRKKYVWLLVIKPMLSQMAWKILMNRILDFCLNSWLCGDIRWKRDILSACHIKINRANTRKMILRRRSRTHFIALNLGFEFRVLGY